MRTLARQSEVKGGLDLYSGHIYRSLRGQWRGKDLYLKRRRHRVTSLASLRITRFDLISHRVVFVSEVSNLELYDIKPSLPAADFPSVVPTPLMKPSSLAVVVQPRSFAFPFPPLPSPKFFSRHTYAPSRQARLIVLGPLTSESNPYRLYSVR